MEPLRLLRRSLIASAPRPRDPLATLLTFGIVACALWSGLEHLSLGSTLFTLNGLGYLGNGVLLLLTLLVPRLRYRVRSYVAAWLALYAALTIVGYLANGAPRSSSAVAALFAEGGIIVGAVALWIAYRAAYARRAAFSDEPVEHWVSAPSPLPFAVAAIAGGLLFFLAANPWASVRCERGSDGAIGLAACDLLFDRSEIKLVAGEPSLLRFENRVAVPHNVAIHRGSIESIGVEIWRGELVNGPMIADYALPALTPGGYLFVCSIHPTMIGELTVVSP